jgi:membrane protease YdiL (CAAX protease family)
MSLASAPIPPSPNPDRFWRIWDLLLAGAIALCLLVLGLIVLLLGLLFQKYGFDLLAWQQLENPAAILQGETFFIAVVWLSAFIFVGGVVLVALLRRKLGWIKLGLRRPTAWGVLFGLAGGVVTMLAMSAATVLTQLILRPFGFYATLENPQLDSLLPPGVQITPGFALWMSLGVGLMVPFAEELFFRGMIYRYLRDKWGVWWAVPVSALIFGLFHVEPSIAVGASVAGVILALSYEYTQSLWVSVLIHAFNNGIKIALLYLVVLLGGRL